MCRRLGVIQHSSLSYTDPHCPSIGAEGGSLVSSSTACCRTAPEVTGTGVNPPAHLLAFKVKNTIIRQHNTVGHTSLKGTEAGKSQTLFSMHQGGCSHSAVQTMSFYIQSRAVEAPPPTSPILYARTIFMLNLLLLHSTSSPLNRISVLHAL